MREILFRGKFSEKSRWDYGDLYIDHGKVYIGSRDIMHGVRVHGEVIPETVGQFAGLTDKNGTKIFEGDIIQASLPATRVLSGYMWPLQDVVFRQGSFGLECRKAFTPLRSFTEAVQFEVIGNIHDNPELMEGK